MKVGILGGSFDPIHNGHIHMAESARVACGLDEVWLVPAGHSPNKKEENMTPAEERLHMCELAAEVYPWLHVNSVEIESSERSYTYRTLQKLTEQFPQHEFYFIMGGDSLDYFEEWCHPEIIASLCKILVIPRDDFDARQMEQKIRYLQSLFPCDIQVVFCRKYPISSTGVRQRIYDGEFPGRDLLPEVISYIHQQHLYGA